MGTTAYWRSFALVALGAALWVMGAMMVAFPGHAFTLNFGGMFSDFLGNLLHPVSIILLWVVDVFIVVACLRDVRIRTAISRWLGLVLGALGIFVIVAVFAPLANPNLQKSYPLLMGLTAMLCIGTARGLSYVATQQGTPI